ncbi:hypothetical protein TNCV_3465101 [Trichonephila clavipes]|nr:hypothetical protein TNCV_3465101 [Trichonephila clavipes]
MCRKSINVASRRRRIPFDYQKTSLAGLAPQIQQPVVASGEISKTTPSRHHLELQDRRDYTPTDRAVRTCWLGCPRLLYYLAA